jgi:hypothetical protein
MKMICTFFMVLFAVTATPISSAGAQPALTEAPLPWVHPKGWFRLDQASSDWVFGAPFTWQGNEFILNLVGPLRDRVRPALCGILESAVSVRPNSSQESLNAAFQNHTAQSMAERYEYNPEGAVSFTNNLIDNVRVYDFVVDSDNLGSRVYYRFFILLTEEGPKYEELSCSAPYPLQDTDASAIKGLLNSLAFAAAEPTP